MLRAHLAGGQLTNSCSSSLRSLLAGPWAPKLARLHNSGSINAWSTGEGNPWIQVRGVLWPWVLLGTVPGHTRSGAPCRRTHSHGRQRLTPAISFPGGPFTPQDHSWHKDSRSSPEALQSLRLSVYCLLQPRWAKVEEIQGQHHQYTDGEEDQNQD